MNFFKPFLLLPFPIQVVYVYDFLAVRNTPPKHFPWLGIKLNFPVVLVANGFHVLALNERFVNLIFFLFLKLGHRADR